MKQHLAQTMGYMEYLALPVIEEQDLLKALSRTIRQKKKNAIIQAAETMSSKEIWEVISELIDTYLDKKHLRSGIINIHNVFKLYGVSDIYNKKEAEEFERGEW